MSNETHTIDVWIVMNEAGAFVVDEDGDVAAERAEEEFCEDEDVRSVQLKITMCAADGTQRPIVAEIKIDYC